MTPDEARSVISQWKEERTILAVCLVYEADARRPIQALIFNAVVDSPPPMLALAGEGRFFCQLNLGEAHFEYADPRGVVSVGGRDIPLGRARCAIRVILPDGGVLVISDVHVRAV